MFPDSGRNYIRTPCILQNLIEFVTLFSEDTKLFFFLSSLLLLAFVLNSTQSYILRYFDRKYILMDPLHRKCVFCNIFLTSLQFSKLNFNEL